MRKRGAHPLFFGIVFPSPSLSSCTRGEITNTDARKARYSDREELLNEWTDERGRFTEFDWYTLERIQGLHDPKTPI
jgi:hypothetical protein